MSMNDSVHLWTDTSLKKCVVVTDFDGIITKQDSIKLLLNKFGSSHWKEVQGCMDSGLLDECTGLELLLNCLRINLAQALNYILNNVSIDDYFYHFLEFAKSVGVEVSIVSSGLRKTVFMLLPRIEKSIKCMSAYEVSYRDSKFVVNSPKYSNMAKYHNPKMAIVQRYIDMKYIVIYVGDGLTDFPAAKLANVVFAKDKLLALYREKSIKYMPFNSFKDIIFYLKEQNLENVGG